MRADAMTADKTRRRHTRIVLTVTGVAIAGLAMTGCGSGRSPVRGGTIAVSGRSPVASARAGPAALLRAGGGAVAPEPRYFADIVRTAGSVAGSGPVQIRSAATGALVSRPAGLDALAIAPLGRGRLLLARQIGDACASQLFAARIGARGRLGSLHRVAGVIKGLVTAVAANTSGSVIGFFSGPCAKSSATGYLAVVHVSSGQIGFWSGVAVLGSGGSVGAGGNLSVSPSGRSVAFSGFSLTAGGMVTGQRVWVLSVSAPSGPLLKRARAIVSMPRSGPALGDAVLIAGGRTVAVCTVTTHGTVSAKRAVTQTVAITARRAADGAFLGLVASLTATDVTFLGQDFGCSLAVAAGGGYLLVPYSARYGASTESPVLVTAARIRLATGQVARFSFRLPGSAGPNGQATGISVAW